MQKPVLVLRSVGVLFLASCGCDTVLGVTTVPQSVTLTVGQTVLATVSLTGCGGRRELVDTFEWVADDTAVVSVEMTSGLITARQPGSTIVAAIGQRYGRVTEIPVTVRPLSGNLTGVAAGGGVMVRAEALAALVSTARSYWIRRS